MKARARASSTSPTTVTCWASASTTGRSCSQLGRRQERSRRGDTLVWLAALVMMATFLAELGLIPWLSEQMSGAVGGMGWIPAFIILTLVYFYSHYLFASNTAHVAAM